jgi:hypothetical protein
MSPNHPTKGGDSNRGRGDYNAFGSYTRRGRDMDKIGTCAVATSQFDDAIIRHGQGKSHV